MKNKTKQIVIIFLWLCGTISPAALAESGVVTGANGAAISVSARLKLRVIIPRFLQFRVGSAGTTIDTITFEPASTDVGNSSSVAGSDTTSVQLHSNAGQITIVANNDSGAGGLGNGGAISLSELTTHSDSPALKSPQLTDTGGTTSTVTLTDGNVTERHATWSYAYKNSHAVEPGSYDAEIVYTAASL